MLTLLQLAGLQSMMDTVGRDKANMKREMKQMRAELAENQKREAQQSHETTSTIASLEAKLVT